MELTFNGHACVTVRTRDGRVVVMDPYRSGAFGGRIAHAPVVEPAEVVTVSHWHVDHSHVTADLSRAGRLPVVVDRSRSCGGWSFTVRPTYHDRVGGTRMGMSGMIAFEVDGVRVAHLGDIGCDLTRADLAALGRVDVLIWPVGGTYTLGPQDADGVLRAVRPRLAVPVHYDNARCRLGMQPLEATLGLLEWPIDRSGRSSWTAEQGLPAVTTVHALEPAL